MSETSTSNHRFMAFAIQPDFGVEISAEPSPILVRGCAGNVLELEAECTHFLFAAAGRSTLQAPKRPEVELIPGMYVVLPGAGNLAAPEGQVLVITRRNYRGLWQMGGPPESEGRLLYIDGCSDTLLVCPPRLGEPCLNHLHVPAHTCQSAHTHPSARIGIITSGSGLCLAGERRYQLQPGMGWYIPAGLLHAFHTEDQSLDVLAWHPDSDFGPTDQCHPMLNRTLL